VAYCEIALGITYSYQKKKNEEANAIADCLGNRFTSHDLCDENHERQVEIRVQVLLASVDETPLGNVRICDTRKLVQTLKLRKVCELDILNEYFRHLSRRPLVYLTHLLNHCHRLSHFPKPWKEAKVITLPKSGKDQQLSQNLRPISLLSTTGKIFEEVSLKIVQRHIQEGGLLNASQFGFRARHNTTLQCMRLADHVT
jgi:hypothetical protein